MKTVAVLGYGGRGRMYAMQCKLMRKSFTVVAVIDNVPAKLASAKKQVGLRDDQLFLEYDDFLAKEKCADILMVCTQDRQHREHAIKGLQAGYDLLLEKPIAPTAEDCFAIEQTALSLGRSVDVCHVLRYTTFYRRIKEIMDSGALGQIVSIDQVENVAYWHQAHSFVRGDWRNTEESAPMILAKCCHDMDIIRWLAGSRCAKLNSSGQLQYFRKENAPEGAAARCMDGCRVQKSCPYDAEKLYIGGYKKAIAGYRRVMWPQSRLMADGMVTLPKLREAVQNGPFGRCVFACDNDVVDYQQVQMQFENGVNASLTMTAFSQKCFRETRVRGTLGEVVANMNDSTIDLYIFGKKKKRYTLRGLGAMGGHGDGDLGLIRALANGACNTDIVSSIDSHVMCFAAEESRTNNSKTVQLEKRDHANL